MGANLNFRFPAGLPHLVMLRPLDAFFDELLIVAAAFSVFVLAGRHLGFLSR